MCTSTVIIKFYKLIIIVTVFSIPNHIWDSLQFMAVILKHIFDHNNSVKWIILGYVYVKMMVRQNIIGGFKSIELFKDQILGIGSFGKVCKAKCDDLQCAVKLLHERWNWSNSTPVYSTSDRAQATKEEICARMPDFGHHKASNYSPISRYYEDPDTGLPVLLMELMDDSLTHFLESFPQLILYHIQVNICHDIILALSFLHSNNIVHQDLSSS